MKPIGKDLSGELMFQQARRLLQRLAKFMPDLDPVTWEAAYQLGDLVWDHSARTCSEMFNTAPHAACLSDDKIKQWCQHAHAGYAVRQEDSFEFELFGREFYQEMEPRQDELDSGPEYFVVRVDTEAELQRVFDLCKSVRSKVYCRPLGRAPKFD